jgi:hypothetical protein
MPHAAVKESPLPGSATRHQFLFSYTTPAWLRKPRPPQGAGLPHLFHCSPAPLFSPAGRGSPFSFQLSTFPPAGRPSPARLFHCSSAPLLSPAGHPAPLFSPAGRPNPKSKIENPRRVHPAATLSLRAGGCRLRLVAPYCRTVASGWWQSLGVGGSVFGPPERRASTCASGKALRRSKRQRDTRSTKSPGSSCSSDFTTSSSNRAAAGTRKEASWSTIAGMKSRCES